jgi:LysM repeat protein
MAETRTAKDVVRGILLSAEMGAKGDHDAYQLSDAQKGRSGWSVGRTQIDLGQQTDRHGEFSDLLKKSGKLTDQEIGSAMGDLSSIGRTKKMSAELQGKVNGVLASKDGKAMLDRWDEGQIEAMVSRVDDARAAARENPRYSSDSAFRRQVDSPAFAGAIAGHANQYENSSRIKEWLRGNEIEVNGTKVKLGDKVPGIDALADIEMNSEYLKADGKEIPKNVEAQHTRWQAIVGQLERQGDVTAEEAGAMRGTVRDRYSTEAQRTNRQDPNQHEVGAGQNLSIIAKQKGVSLEDLQRANPDKAPGKLKPGDFLRVPTSEEIEQWKRDREKAQISKKKISELTPEDAERQGMSTADFLKAKNEELAANGSSLPNGPQVASASAGLDRQILAEQATPVPEQKPSEPSADPKVAAMVEMSGQPVDNPGKAALLKPVETLTQSEMTDMINSAQGDYRGYRSGDPLKAHTYERVQDWHAAMYGDGPQANDGGKPVDPTPVRAIPIRPIPCRVTYKTQNPIR